MKRTHLFREEKEYSIKSKDNLIKFKFKSYVSSIQFI